MLCLQMRSDDIVPAGFSFSKEASAYLVPPFLLRSFSSVNKDSVMTKSHQDHFSVTFNFDLLQSNNGGADDGEEQTCRLVIGFIYLPT